MADEPRTPDTTPVTDHRPIPRGVLPRGIQTWLMAGLAVGMLLIIFLAGRPKPPEVQRPAPTSNAGALNSDAVRQYQERLRMLETEAARENQAARQPAPSPAPEFSGDTATTTTQDPTVEERRRREYESLFASNVVLGPTAERGRVAPEGAAGTGDSSAIGGSSVPTAPSLDRVAEAVVRATLRSQQEGPASGGAGGLGTAARPTPPSAATAPRSQSEPTHTKAISDAGPAHRILEGTVIDAVLTNRLDGSMAAPVNCLVTNPVYSYDGQQVVIPAGSRVLGDSKPVEALGQARLAVAFHRLILPDGSTYSLDGFPGLNQLGDAGLRDQVNHHYWSTFGAAAAVGLISGLAQSVGTAGLSAGTGNRTIVIAGGAADATSQASAQVIDRFLNRLPTVTIREGHRVKVYLTRDLELPAYRPTARDRF